MSGTRRSIQSVVKGGRSGADGSSLVVCCVGREEKVAISFNGGKDCEYLLIGFGKVRDMELTEGPHHP